MPENKSSKFTKAQLTHKRKRATIYFVLLVLLNALYLLGVILSFFYGVDISVFILIPVFFVLFMLAVAANLMRVRVEQELRKLKG